MADRISPSQTMAKRVGREWMMLRFRGFSGRADGQGDSINENVTGHRLPPVPGLPGHLSVRLVGKPGHGKPACAVDADDQKQLAFDSLHIGDIDVKDADGMAFEPPPLRRAALPIMQPGGHGAAGTDAAPSASDAGGMAAEAGGVPCRNRSRRNVCSPLERERQQRVPTNALLPPQPRPRSLNAVLVARSQDPRPSGA